MVFWLLDPIIGHGSVVARPDYCFPEDDRFPPVERRVIPFANLYLDGLGH
jgi:hypothetical protein